LHNPNSEASRPVTALPYLAAVGIEDSHMKICPVATSFGYDHLITTDPSMAIRQALDLGRREIDNMTHAIEHYEVITQRMHLGKFKHGHPTIMGSG
jgi:hypothetical protein